MNEQPRRHSHGLARTNRLILVGMIGITVNHCPADGRKRLGDPASWKKGSCWKRTKADRKWFPEAKSPAEMEQSRSMNNE
jgi:hypothetical protein